jgi:hypothetical protein
MPGWEFQGRRMIKYMALMNFPRYINRESRDFFFLTLRHILPGAAIPADLGAKQSWQTKGLPQHGWPFAIATATLSPDKKRPHTQLEAVKLDARMLALAPAGAPTASADTVITFAAGQPGKSPLALWWTRRGFSIASPSDSRLTALEAKQSAKAVGFGIAPEASAGKVIVAAAGVDAAGFAVYLEIMSGHERGSDTRLLSSTLAELGCSQVVLFEQSLLAANGGVRGLDGRAPTTQKRGVHLVRGVAPGARRFFKDTPVVHPDIWAPLQRKRVRYFRKPTPAQPSDAEAPPAPAPTPVP